MQPKQLVGCATNALWNWSCGALSPAEFALVKAYLDRSERETQGCLSEAVKQLDAPRSAKIIWLKDKIPGRDAVKVRSLQFK
jgi:hypothetical protein